MDTHTLIGTFTINSSPSQSTNDVSMVPVQIAEPLTTESMLWAFAVLTVGSAIGFMVHTRAETRVVTNASHPQAKVGLRDLEINRLAKVQLNFRKSASC